MLAPLVGVVEFVLYLEATTVHQFTDFFPLSAVQAHKVLKRLLVKLSPRLSICARLLQHLPPVVALPVLAIS